MYYYLICISKAISSFCEGDLVAMLKTSLKNNQKNNLTGMTLYGDGTFIQLLEGDQAVVEASYKKILKDSRHTGFMKLITGEEKERTFTDWSMGFKAADISQLEGVTGYVRPGDMALDRDTLSAPLFMLKTFAENHRLIA